MIAELVVVLILAAFCVACEYLRIDPAVRKPLVPRLRVRWIETRGCMAEDYRVEHGVVLETYKDVCYPTQKPEPFFHIRLDNGTIIKFPKIAFIRAEDGVYEYRY